jgi:hypothetical protein
LRSPWKVRGSKFSGKMRSLGSTTLTGEGGEGDEELFVIQKPSNAESRGKGLVGGQDGLELEERGLTPTTPTTLGHERDMESSAEDLGFHHGGGSG